jgi:hypothetical protein
VQPKAVSQAFANAFWGWLAAGGVVWYFANWKWALIFVVLAILSAIESIRATRRAIALEKALQDFKNFRE